MKAKKVYEFVNPRQREVKKHLGLGADQIIKEQIREDFEQWLSEYVFTDYPPKFKINEDNKVIVLEDLSVAEEATKIPDYVIEVQGDLDIIETNIEYIKHPILVKGDFNGYSSSLREFPNIIGANNYLVGNTYITKFPGDFFECFGNLNAADLPNMKKLPDRMYVEGDLNLTDCSNLEDLGHDLEVKGDLKLTYTKVYKLPMNLHCHDLDLSFSHITVIPDGLNITGKIELEHSKRNIIELPEGMSLDDINWI